MTDQHEQSRAVAVQDRPAPRQIVAVMDASPLFDTAQFDHFLRIAQRMARASILPDHLQVYRDEDGQIVKASEGEFDVEGTIGNCLAVINTARAWNLDPMAVAECMAMVHGRRCYEGKLIAAVIETRLGINLKHEWSGEPGTPAYQIDIYDPDQPEHSVTGTVAEWQTKSRSGDINGQWVGKANQKRMLKNRGDREWCRMWAPALLLGAYADDELQELAEDARARRATPITPASRRLAPAPADNGFNNGHVRRELGGEQMATEVAKPAEATSATKVFQTGAQSDAEGKPTPSGPSGDEPRASDQGSLSSDSEATESSVGAEQSPHSSEPAEAGSPAATENEAAANNGAAPAEGSTSNGGPEGSSDAAAGPSDGGRAGPAIGAPPTSLYASFGDALFRADKGPASLKAIVKQFWERNEYPDIEDQKKVLAEIHTAHVERIKSNNTDEAVRKCRETIKELVYS